MLHQHRTRVQTRWSQIVLSCFKACKFYSNAAHHCIPSRAASQLSHGQSSHPEMHTGFWSSLKTTKQQDWDLTLPRVRTPTFVFHCWLSLFYWQKFTPYRSSCSVKKSVLCEHASIRSALMQCPELFLQGWSLDCNKCQISVINPSPPKLQKPLKDVYFHKANAIEKSPPRHVRS